MRKKSIFNEFGFSLVQSMVIAAALAGSSLVATRLMVDQKMSQKNAETRDQIEDLHTVIYSILQNRANCQATIQGPLHSLPNPNNVQNNLMAGSNPQLSAIYNSASTVPVYQVYNNLGDRSDIYMNGNVIIQSMRIEYAPGDGTGRANLIITYERQNYKETQRTKKGYGAKVISKTIGLRIQRNPFDAGKPFQSCYASTASKADSSAETGNDISRELCLQMNNGVVGDGSIEGTSVFVWDEATSTCIPNAKCPTHEIFTGIDSVGDVKCRPIGTWFDLNKMIDANSSLDCSTGKRVRFKLNATDKKVSIECY